MYSSSPVTYNMGCISSKLVSRSLSFQEELNKSMKRSANGISALEEAAISGNINDQFLALVCTANTVACQYRSGSFSDKSNKPVVEPDITLTKTKWEFNSSLEQEGLEARLLLPQIPSIDLTKRSRSCHLFSTNEVSRPSVESFHGLEENKRNQKGVGRAKSFHTIEEFDALIEKLKLSTEQQIGYDGKGDGSGTKVQLNHFQSSYHASDHTRDGNDMQEIHSHMKDRTPPEANSIIEENSTLSTSDQVSRKQITIPSRSNTTTESETVEESPQRHMLNEGARRKSFAKRLESLEIPQAIELPAVASLREWLRAGGQVYSPGAYITPKFGSYSLPICGTPNECNEEAIFSPDLVAASEESMERLEAEAESILKQIVQNLEQESTVDKQAKDDFLSHSNSPG
ncbi:unnamed protein product [Dovyalis caffra]|uniref:Uncharacterized protein n=1 Tax=Dovyalis caffra TaxID=77055 RepID=A0AAV1QQW9_9ROSI|nr:unnamed protein product [Dovyalis caffra]